ncbi:hypothetical protein RND71_004293 [Anisodus tanguticus]|uniref:Uncharacterized protein n=1 Tax=Anisodus tanguticus TaxID=243964 RepID=A0AAE1SXM1_9SOLA|nr:hypothetical protein RND71_004293 [Anisodus tanguticus]
MWMLLRGKWCSYRSVVELRRAGDKQTAKGTIITREEGKIGNEKTGDNQDECSITISENEIQWLSSLEKSGGDPANGSSQKLKMERVPRMLREIESNISCYEPIVVAIGPFHHGKQKLQPMEKSKEKFSYQFADQDSTKNRREGVLRWLSTNSVSIDDLYKKVKNIMPNVRECYADEFIKDYSDEEFAQMMFLDGGLILHYIHCLVTGNYKQLKMKSRDIGVNELDKTWERRRAFLYQTRKHEKSASCVHLFELLQKHLIDPKDFSEYGICYLIGEWSTNRSAMELRGAGIDFGLVIDDATKSLFLNLVAYEALPDTPDDFGVTSYLCFMSSLIYNVEDVKELRSKGILLNFLGPDQQVADLFKEMARDLVPNPYAFDDVKLHMKITDIALIRRDLFLLENQLPFEVLQVLMTYKFNKDEGMKMIKQFISSSHVSPPQEHGFIHRIKDFFGGNPFSPETTNGKGQDPERPAHLLELLRTHLIDPKAFLEGG